VEPQRHSAPPGGELQPGKRANDPEIGFNQPGHVNARGVGSSIGSGFV